jgi:hypothetical protein
MSSTEVIVIALLVLPHISLGVAWGYWFRSQAKFQTPKRKGNLQLAGLLAGSLNIVLFWGYIAWLQRHHNDFYAWKTHDFVNEICEFLNLLTIAGAFLGRTRGSTALCVAGVLGWFLWVTTSIGVL